MEVEAVAGGPARVGRNADVSARDERCHIRVPVIDHLAGRPAVGQYESGIASGSLQIERHPQQRRDGLAVEGLVVNDLRWRKRRRVKAGNGGEGQSIGMPACEVDEFLLPSPGATTSLCR